MKNRTMFVAGGLVGYVLGARAGRQRYEQIAALARRIANMAPVQQATDAATQQATNLAGTAKHAMSERVSAAVAQGGQKIAEKLGDKVPSRFRSEPEPAAAPAPHPYGTNGYTTP